jgi:4,5-DOPA dioxygenase extradiol
MTTTPTSATRSAPARPASLFVSHGAPTLPLDDVPARAFLRGLGGALPKPRAIVAISAHTVARGVLVGSAPRMHAVHDFGGFPDALYRLRYDAPGDPALAARLATRLRDAGIAPLGEATIDGLDHGIWVPLSQMYPEADVPVVVVSLDARMDAATHLAIGRALRGLDAEGVLVFASGSVTHNLRDVFGGGREIAAPKIAACVECPSAQRSMWPPVFLDRRATAEQAVSLIREAAGHGAELVVFPESCIPAFPVWAALWAPILNHDLSEAMVEHSVDVPGPEVVAIANEARRLR